MTTTQGRALTLEHRTMQGHMASQAEAEARSAMRFLDLDDLDGSTAYWSAIQTGILRTQYAASQDLALRYISDFRALELGSSAGVLVAPPFNDAASQVMLRVTGPVAIKTLIGQGVSPEAALSVSRRAIASRAQKWSLGGGRGAIQHTALADARSRRYRRVAGSGKTCAFCAMLISASILYRTSSRAAFRAHGHCRCTAEIVYGRPEPTDDERQLIEAYRTAADVAAAAGQKRTAANILPRMRASGLFTDSPAT